MLQDIGEIIFPLNTGLNSGLLRKRTTVDDTRNVSLTGKRRRKNERKKALTQEKYNEYVRFPKEPCRLDTVIQNGDRFEYYYSQNIERMRIYVRLT